jgi:fatty-acyl-CoA synthase
MIIGDVRTTGRAGGRRGWAVSTTVGDLYDQTAEAFGSGDLVFPGERCTYAELADRADALARSLRGLGVGAGDNVGILLVPGLDNVAAIGAIAKLGAVSVPINARFKERELAHVIADADLVVLLVSPTVPGLADYPGLVRAALPGLAGQAGTELSLAEAPLLRTLVLMEPGDEPSFLSRAHFDAHAAAVPPAEIDTLQERVRLRDTAIIMYTSGTEANPKGCLLSHEALVRTGLNIAHTRFALTPADRLWNPLPMFHCGGIVLLMASLSAGTSYIHAGFFDPGVALDQLEQERCTIAHPAFETIWLAVLSHPRFAEADLSAVRIVLAVGVPERLRAMHETLPHAVPFCSFGSTEACSHLALSTPEDDLDHRFTTGGHPLPGMEVRIVDPETGEDLPPDVEGEVLYRGPDLFDGYYKSPELNARCFDADGWFHSRDVGVLDDDGRLTFRSRLKDMLKVGGENVGAAEIENVIAEHPAVLIVQVVAAPDARYVEVPAAFVQLKAGAECTEDEIVQRCIGQIANFKVPRYVRLVGEWPMSGTKIRKVALREQIAAELEAAGITEAPPLASGAGGAAARPQATGG